LIKNLDILLSGRTLSDLIIVDNKSAMYCDHVFNGIPISDYHGEQSDKALIHLKDYLLKRILPAEDVRQVIKEDFLDAVFIAPAPQIIHNRLNHSRNNYQNPIPVGPQLLTNN